MVHCVTLLLDQLFYIVPGLCITKFITVLTILKRSTGNKRRTANTAIYYEWLVCIILLGQKWPFHKHVVIMKKYQSFTLPKYSHHFQSFNLLMEFKSGFFSRMCSGVLILTKSEDYKEFLQKRFNSLKTTNQYLYQHWE